MLYCPAVSLLPGQDVSYTHVGVTPCSPSHGLVLSYFQECKMDLILQMFSLQIKVFQSLSWQNVKTHNRSREGCFLFA